MSKSRIHLCSPQMHPGVSLSQFQGRGGFRGGWQRQRVSPMPRKPLLETPGAWEQQLLAWQKARAENPKLPPQSLQTTTAEPAGVMQRYLQEIPLAPHCAACHGGSADIAPATRERLALEYPHDLATGYAVGDQRGAFAFKRLRAEGE